ncbi:MAG: hypothetical protein QW400_04610 [Candidatus Diapherotrites archaeon]
MPFAKRKKTRASERAPKEVGYAYRATRKRKLRKKLLAEDYERNILDIRYLDAFERFRGAKPEDIKVELQLREKELEELKEHIEKQRSSGKFPKKSIVRANILLMEIKALRHCLGV